MSIKAALKELGELREALAHSWLARDWQGDGTLRLVDSYLLRIRAQLVGAVKKRRL